MIEAASVFEAFSHAAERHGDNRPLLHIVEETAHRYGCKAGGLSYGEASERCADLIGAYSVLGIQTGTRIALALDNRPGFFLHWLALNALGASVVPLNPHWQKREIFYALQHSEAKLVVAPPLKLRQISCALPETCRTLESEGSWTRKGAGMPSRVAASGDMECALLYTSGTTGRPKGCILSNNYFLESGAWYRDLGGYCRLRPGEDRLITPLPMHHMNAMAVSTMGMLMSGGCIVPLDRFHPSSWWKSVRESGASIMHYLGVMPAMLMGLPESPEDGQHQVRFGFGAGLSGELHAAFEARFRIPLVEAWAMTETGCATAIIASGEPRKIGTGCIGRPPSHIEIRLIDDSGAEVANGEAGELLIRRAGTRPGFGMFSGYLKDERATAEVWQGGYFHTGDLVRLDAGGLLHFLDRKKNIIRRSGENISAVEVEETLLGFPGVAAVGVAPVPDAVRGDEVFACVVMADGDTPWEETARAMVNHCLEHLAYFKAPGYLTRCAALPLTATEKIQRGALRELARERLDNGDYMDARPLKTAARLERREA